jgi:glucan-binding YG repeat protein
MALKEIIRRAFSRKTETYTPQREAMDRQHDSLQRELSALQKKKEIPEMRKKIKELSKEVYGTTFDKNPMGNKPEDKMDKQKQERQKRSEVRYKQIRKLSKALHKPARWQKYTTENITYRHQQPPPSQKQNILIVGRTISPIGNPQSNLLREQTSILNAPNTIIQIRRRV